MREYGQVQCSFWSDPDMRSLSDDAKLLALYLLTGPHSNGLGCYRLPEGYVQADFGWTADRVSKRYAELYQMGFCKRCESTDFVLIPKFMKWNPVANPKVAVAREKEFRNVPKKSTLYQQLAASMAAYGGHWSDAFANHIETISKGYAKQDPILPNPEQDPEQDPNKPLSGSKNPEPDRSDEVRQVFAHWQTAHGHERAKLDDKRYKAIRARLSDGYSVDDLMAAVDGCLKSPHHQGENDRSTKYDDIELICRSAKHVDQFIRFAEGPDLTSMGSSARQTAIAAAEWIAGGSA